MVNTSILSQLCQGEVWLPQVEVCEQLGWEKKKMEYLVNSGHYIRHQMCATPPVWCMHFAQTKITGLIVATMFAWQLVCEPNQQRTHFTLTNFSKSAGVWYSFFCVYLLKLW